MLKSTVTPHKTKVCKALMLSPIPRHTALINTDDAPTMGAIFTLAIRQSFGLSLLQPSTPQIHPDSIIPLACLWPFGLFGHMASREMFYRIPTAQSTKLLKKNIFFSLFFIYSCIPASLTSLLNKNETLGAYKHCPGKYFMRTIS